MTKEEINSIFVQCENELESIGIPIREAVWETAKYTSLWGTCHVQTNGPCRIKLAKRLADSDNDHLIRKTIAHELIHTCSDCWAHGEVWRDYARKADNAFGYDIFTFDSSVYPEKYVYDLICPRCGAKGHTNSDREQNCPYCHKKMIKKETA